MTQQVSLVSKGKKFLLFRGKFTALFIFIPYERKLQVKLENDLKFFLGGHQSRPKTNPTEKPDLLRALLCEKR